jgi:hypothetical protein
MKRLTIVSSLAALAVAGAGTAILVSSADSASPDDKTIFCTIFVPVMDTSTLYGKWYASNKGEREKWLAFRSAICAGQSPLSPVLVTPFGRALVAAGQMALPEVAPPPTTTSATTTTTSLSKANLWVVAP